MAVLDKLGAARVHSAPGGLQPMSAPAFEVAGGKENWPLPAGVPSTTPWTPPFTAAGETPTVNPSLTQCLEIVGAAFAASLLSC